MKYIVLGLNQLDGILYSGKSEMEMNIGGIPMYGWSGMRPWTDSICFHARVGEDFYEKYNPWFDDNNIDRSGIKIVSEETPYCVIKYDESMNFSDGYFFTRSWKDAEFWRPHGEDVAQLAREDTKGIYICSPAPPFAPNGIWEELFSLREKKGIKIMWEPNSSHTKFEDHDATIELCKKIDMASFNLAEGKEIFGVDTEEELLKTLKGLDMDITLLRMGSRGMHVISKGESWLVPATITPDIDIVDVTGCGNTSTAGVLVARCEGDDPVMSAIKGSISAMYNLMQKGPYPKFTEKEESEALAFANKLYSERSE